MRNRPSMLISGAIASIVIYFACTASSLAGEVTLAWDPHDNTHANLGGYYLYYKENSSVQDNPNGCNLIYIALTDPGFDPDHPTYTVTDLLDDTQYFFTVTAMVEDDESSMSNEVSAINDASALDTTPGTSSSGSGGSSAGGCFISTLK